MIHQLGRWACTRLRDCMSLGACMGLLAGAALAADTSAAGEGDFVFGWPFADPAAMQPRGGSTQGPDVELVRAPTQAFQRLRASGLSPRERDRRAILAMAGDYRVSFDFIEVLGFAPDFVPAAPYRSWGTERVYVLEDRPDVIVLQHVLVTTVVDANGERQGPFVVKHWRQDWRYQAPTVHRYAGDHVWQAVAVPASAGSGYWVQSVWQVDDSPRYAGWGHWVHEANHSTWLGNLTLRPLPRREYSVRDDYDLLAGTNRHTVVATGWLHEQENLKRRMHEGRPGKALAKEYGVARYEAIRGYDFSAGDAYVDATGPFWAAVRDWWEAVFARRDRVRLRGAPDQGGLLRALYGRAQAIAEGADFTAAGNDAFIADTLAGYLELAPERAPAAAAGPEANLPPRRPAESMP